MKKTFVFSALIVACLLMATEAWCQFDENIETPLDLNGHYMNRRLVNHHDSLFRARFRVDDSTTPFDMTPTMIDIGAITKSLYTPAKDAMVKDDACKNNRECMTGVRITLGIEDKRVVYYFQPLYMIQTSPNSKEFNVRDVDSKSIWHYVNGQFLMATDLSPIRNYISRVRVKHYEDAPFEPGVEVPDNISWKGDTKSIVYTFKEIYMIHEKVKLPEIGFHNGSDLFRRNFLNRWRAKHLVYIKVGSSAILSINTDQSAANFAHLCPPKCHSVDF